MATRLTEVALALALVAAGGCSDDDEPARDSGVTEDAPSTPPVIEATDENNYSIEGTIDIPSVTTASATDLQICWDGMLHDIQCHELDPAEDIDNVGLIRFDLTQEEIEARMGAGTLQQADMTGYLELHTDGATCGALADFSLFGTPVDVTTEYYAGGGTYMLVFTTGTTPGVGARMLQFLAPDEASAVVDVAAGDGCGVVTVDANLHDAAPLAPPGVGAWTLDWSALTTDGQGNPLASGRIDGLLIGYYADTTVVDLEGRVLDLLVDATWMWQAPGTVIGHTYDFDADWGDGTGFGAYPADSGVWLVALTCSRCYTPAPLFVSVLEPRDP